jgi:hypothetical protein
MDSQSVTSFINQLSNRDPYAAEEMWRHMTTPLREFALQKLDPQSRRRGSPMELHCANDRTNESSNESSSEAAVSGLKQGYMTGRSDSDMK